VSLRLRAALGALYVASVACAVPATNLPCSSASLLGPYPYPNDAQLSGARIGPLLVQGDYEAGSRRAVVHNFAAGRPTKMRLLITSAIGPDLTLTGMRCGDAKPLRFWLDHVGAPPGLEPTSPPVSEDVMSATGDLRIVLPRRALSVGATFAIDGYILFPSLGTYRIEGYSGDRYVGDATLEVTSEIPVAGGGAAGYRSGVCVESPSASGLGLVGGDLAAAGAEDGYASSSDVPVVWRRRTKPAATIDLRADRLDDDGRKTLSFSGPVDSAAPDGWSSASFVGTIGIGVSGCWRIRDLTGTPSDFIVMRIGPHRSGRVGSPGPLPFAPGEREVLRNLQDAGVWITDVLPSRDDALLGGVGEARYLSTAPVGAFNVLFLPDASTADAIRVCGERTPAGRYVYRLSLGGRSDTIEWDAPTAFIVSANALAIVGYTPELAGAVRHALAGRNASC
jgi:hypothetical protein